MAAHDIVVKLANLDTSVLVDISEIALEKKATVRHNHTRQFVIECPAGHALLTATGTMGDGVPNLHRGDRKLLVWQDDTIVHHGRIFLTERVGDGEKNMVTITSMDPLMELGFDADDRAGRPVRDSTGNFISPVFNDGDPVSGPELIYQILTNGLTAAAENPGPGGEGPLPIHLDSGNFDTGGVDLNPRDNMQWPMLIGDFVQMLVDTNVVDIYLRPIDPAESLDAYAMVEFFARDLYGTDKHDTVHFDYWTGSFNAGAARHVEDFATINNKLYDYLGPRLNQNQWKSNITPSGYPDGMGGATWGSEVTDAVAASRARYGTFMQIRALDSTQAEDAVRPLYVAGWLAEQTLRLEPRPILLLTPSLDVHAAFEPYTDYNVGDLIAVNVGGDFGVDLAGIQRVYGFDVEWDRQGVQRVTNLIVSADEA